MTKKFLITCVRQVVAWRRGVILPYPVTVHELGDLKTKGRLYWAGTRHLSKCRGAGKPMNIAPRCKAHNSMQAAAHFPGRKNDTTSPKTALHRNPC